MNDSRSSECFHLCNLIDDSLSSFHEIEGASLTKEKEKDLLVSLSKVFGEIELWIKQLNGGSDDENIIDPAYESECSNSHSEDSQCLSKIVVDLIGLLTVESQYVHHLVGKVFVGISEFVVASGSSWDIFVKLLCDSMTLTLNRTLSYAKTSSTVAVDLSADLSAGSVSVLKPKLKYANWSTVAGIIRILRNILKYLKQENDDQLFDLYLDSVNSSFSTVRWDFLDDETYDFQNANIKGNSSSYGILASSFGEKGSKLIFFGSFVQLLCSLVEENNGVGILNKHIILSKIISLIPKLLYWCLGKRAESVNTCILQYFKHKLLVLMIRVSSITHLEYSNCITWLQLIHVYFEENLFIAQLESADNCLEGSPFLSFVSDPKVHDMNCSHSQRQAVFLFLSCSLSLIGMKFYTDKQYARTKPNSVMNCNSSSDFEGNGEKKHIGFLELYKWLKCHLPTDTSLGQQMYLRKCRTFSSSLLRLYMHEDDTLFKLLLQLLNFTFCAEQWFNEELTIQNVEEYTLYHVSNLFNPVHLFHLLLKELDYDHQMLLDYLVSKDTGIKCAEYLLRCLRIVCDSWNLFVEFSTSEEVIDQSFCKKRKSVLDESNFQVDLGTSWKNNGILPSFEMQGSVNHEHRSKFPVGGQPFTKAKECLLSMKCSLDSLHQKSLFPYNPKMLLKRLTIFQELCCKQEKGNLSKNGGIT